MECIDFTFFSFLRSVVMPVLFVLIYQLVKDSERGTLNGTMNAVFQFSSAVGGMASSILYEIDSSFNLNVWITAIFFCVGSFTYSKNSKTNKSMVYQKP